MADILKYVVKIKLEEVVQGEGGERERTHGHAPWSTDRTEPDTDVASDNGTEDDFYFFVVRINITDSGCLQVELHGI